MRGILSAGSLEELLERRTDANERFFNGEAAGIAQLCERMAERFACGGRLLALGASPQARSDARHVAVEFVHPVIVGKRALPALALTGGAAPLPRQLDLLAEPHDLAIAFEPGEEVAPALALARARGCLTVATAAAGAEWEFSPPGDDPFVYQELSETLYHVLWGARARLPGAPRILGSRRRCLELPLPLPRRRGAQHRGRRGRRARVGAGEGRRDRRAASANPARGRS